MGKIVLTPDAEARLNDVLSQYKEQILSKISIDNLDGKQVADIGEVNCAIKSSEKEKYLSANLKLKSIRLVKMLALIAMTSAILSLFAIFVTIIIDKDVDFGKRFVDTINYISVFFFITCSLLAYVMSRKASNNSKKSSKIIEFINKWRRFERILRQIYTNDKHRTPSFIDLMSNYLHVFDETYVEKPKDFRYALKIRNEIIHGDVRENISVEELDKAIGTLDKLISNASKMQNGFTL